MAAAARAAAGGRSSQHVAANLLRWLAPASAARCRPMSKAPTSTGYRRAAQRSKRAWLRLWKLACSWGSDGRVICVRCCKRPAGLALRAGEEAARWPSERSPSDVLDSGCGGWTAMLPEQRQLGPEIYSSFRVRRRCRRNTAPPAARRQAKPLSHNAGLVFGLFDLSLGIPVSTCREL